MIYKKKQLLLFFIFWSDNIINPCMESYDMHRQIQEIFGGLNQNFSLMEDPVDMNIQMRYFDISNRVGADFKEEEMLARKDELYDPAVSREKKMILLVQMASVPSPEIYRIIENYAGNPDEGLQDWSKLALHESKLLLESHFLEHKQVFITSGLGGKGHKLRYFVVLINKKGSNLKPFEQKVVHSEMSYALQKYDSELEKLDFMQRYTTMRVVVPLSSDLTRVFREGIDECNQFGDFLLPDFIVTNLKEMSEEEINKALSMNMITEDDYFPPVD